MQNLKCQQCGRHIDSDNHAELHDIVARKREVLEFCNYACASKYISGEEHSAQALKEFGGEVMDDE